MSDVNPITLEKQTPPDRPAGNKIEDKDLPVEFVKGRETLAGLIMLETNYVKIQQYLQIAFNLKEDSLEMQQLHSIQNDIDELKESSKKQMLMIKAIAAVAGGLGGLIGADITGILRIFGIG